MALWHCVIFFKYFSLKKHKIDIFFNDFNIIILKIYKNIYYFDIFLIEKYFTIKIPNIHLIIKIIEVFWDLHIKYCEILNHRKKIGTLMHGSIWTTHKLFLNFT